jgi:hypothetical protein
MGGACGTSGRQERCINGFWWGDVRGRDHLKGLGIDGKSVQMDLQEVGRGGVDKIDLGQCRDI